MRYRKRDLSHKVLAAWLSVLGLGALLSCGCTNETSEEKGTLLVPFRLGTGKDCRDVGVEVVEVSLNDGDYSEEVGCDAGEVRLGGLDSGSYWLAVFGLDEDGVAIMDSGQEQQISVETDTTVVVDPAVRLTDAPAYLKLRWNLGFGTCESVAIEEFQVTAWSQDGNQMLLDTTVPCELDDTDENDYRDVPDPDRELDGDDFGQVQIQPLDTTGNPVGGDEPATFSFKSPKPGRTVKLSLSCGRNGCEGSGKRD